MLVIFSCVGIQASKRCSFGIPVFLLTRRLTLTYTSPGFADERLMTTSLLITWRGGYSVAHMISINFHGFAWIFDVHWFPILHRTTPNDLAGHLCTKPVLFHLTLLGSGWCLVYWNHPVGLFRDILHPVLPLTSHHSELCTTWWKCPKNLGQHQVTLSQVTHTKGLMYRLALILKTRCRSPVGLKTNRLFILPPRNWTDFSAAAKQPSGKSSSRITSKDQTDQTL